MIRNAWIIGERGLLGAAVSRALRQRPDRFTVRGDASIRVPWGDTSAAHVLLEALGRRFFTQCGREPWSIFWCAGAGVVGASEEDLSNERSLLQHLLEVVGERSIPGTSGFFFLASSAGGLYAGCKDLLISEDSIPSPISAYGRSKLVQERMVEDGIPAESGILTLTGRLSTLYGPGQNIHKPQGLISQLTRSVILGYPANVFVPLETRRDFHYADDCATEIVETACRLVADPDRLCPERRLTKIFASERETSIAEIIAILRKISRRPVRIVVAPSSVSRQHANAQPFRSRVPPLADPGARTPIREGIHRVLLKLHALLQEGTLDAPQGMPLLTR